MHFPRLEPLRYEEAVRFHGHDGPFLALGYRFGETALRTFATDSIKGITTSVTIPMRTPYSCFIDGLQCAACTTMGKRNVFAENTDAEEIFVEVTKGEERARFRMTERAIDICRNTGDLAKAVALIFSENPENLWERVD